MNYIQYMKPGSKFWALPNGLEDVSWSEFWSNWKKDIAKAKEQIVDNWENLKQDYKDAADPTAASERKQAESIEATRAKQASIKFVSDNRTDYEKKRDRKNFKLKEFEQKEQLNKDATDAVMWTLTGIPYAVQHLASPNGVIKTYGNTKAVIQNGGGPYLEKAVASAAGDVLDAAILTAPLFTPEAQLARQLNKNIKEGVQLGQYYHGSPNRSIAQFKVGKDGGIYFTPSKDAAKLYTGLFGTGKVYNANLNLGDNVVTIDNGGRPWTKIPEEVVAKEFGITKQQVHDIIGSYNLGETPWHYGLTKHFGYRPKNNYYAIDLVVRLGKDLGVTGLVIQNARDNGKRLFSKNIPYDQTIVFDPKLITLNPLHAADEAVLRGQLGWAPKQTIPYRHGSLDPELKTFVPKHDRWDVVTHGADPNMYFVTDQTTPVSAANMMDLRPYQYTGSIVAEKPMVQVGDFNIAGKNATRNQLIARARQQGADTYLLQDIVDNKVPHLNIVARFIGPEGEAVQGGAASIKWYGPTMGKTTAAKTSLLNLEDIDPLLKPIRAKHAERLGLKISDPKVSADPLYKQEVADFVLEWRANPENQGKTLVASTKHLLDPQYKVEFANEPSIPDFETFAARNKARGFKETDEQLRAWYNSILELGRDLNVDNRYVSDIESGTRFAKISAEELAGTPKVIRNLPISLRRLLGEGPYDELAGKGIFGSLIGEGSESAVYLHASDPTKVLKVNVDINGNVNKGRHAAIKRYIDRRNSLGIQLPIELEGVVLSHGQYRPVFSQKKVRMLDDILEDYAVWRDYEENILAPFLEKQGFKLISEGIYDKVVDGTSYRFSDIGPYNIGIAADGNPILFDADVIRTELLTGKKFKSGGTIHIKKKNIGSFTRYCNGKVTEECIRRGKNSSNPTTRKRANFAANARKWKHEEGGTINYLNYFK